jgi:hypothetical protein
MFQRHTRIKIALAALLAGALALPGLAAARGDRDWDDGRRGDWSHERGDRYDRGDRRWDYRKPSRYSKWYAHPHRHHHRYHRPDVVVIERPAYRRFVAPPRPILGWDDGVTVIRKRSW